MDWPRLYCLGILAAVFTLATGCSAGGTGRIAEARDIDARGIGADVGTVRGSATSQPANGAASTAQTGGINLAADPMAAKGNATTQPIEAGNTAVGQSGAVNAAFTYASAGLSLGVVIVSIMLMIVCGVIVISSNADMKRVVGALERIAITALRAGHGGDDTSRPPGG